MDIKNLTTFIYVAELNSFTKAAEKLGFSQSTVSFQIKQLEHELNFQLFERVNHTIALTEKGREVLDYAHKVNKLTLELKQNMQDTDAIRGHVRMAMADSLCSSFFGKNYASFEASYPQIALKIITAGTGDMLRLVDHNEVDLVLTLDSHIYNREYVIIREEKVGVHFVAGAGYPLSRNSKLSIRDLLSQPFILTEKGMSYRRLLDERLAEMSLEIRPVLEIGSTDLICSLLEQNLGISLLPDYVTAEKAAEGRLVLLDVEDLEIEVWKQLLYHRNKWVSPQMETVMRHCEERAFRQEDGGRALQ